MNYKAATAMRLDYKAAMNNYVCKIKRNLDLDNAGKEKKNIGDEL